MKKSISKSLALKKPVDVFKECPRCHCKELIPVMGDVLCSSCSWDSIEQYANALFDQKIGILFRPSERSIARYEEEKILNTSFSQLSIVA
jgi:hypothetical protein